MKLYSKVVCVALLLSSSIDFSSDIFQAIQHKDKKTVKQWLKSNLDVNLVNDQGQTVLMQAVIKGNKRLVKKLIKKGVQVNALDNAGKTALDYAVEMKKSAIAFKLDKKGARVTTEENYKKLKRIKAIERLKKAMVVIGSYVVFNLLGVLFIANMHHLGMQLM